MNTIFSIASSAFNLVINVVISGVATAVVVFVVGAATKPSYESFAPSFDAF